MLIRGNYRLRAMEELDLPRVLEWRNSDHVHANMFADHLITMEEHRDWFKQMGQDPRTLPMVFEVQRNPVGLVYFNDIVHQNNKCTWSFYLGEKDLPGGTGLAMGFMGLEQAFEDLGIRKVYAEVLAFNVASIKAHQRLGFRKGERLIKHTLKNGLYHDVISFEQNYDDWKKNKGSLEMTIFVKKGP